MNKSLDEHRCKYCRKLFFKGFLNSGFIEIKCRYCKNINIINGISNVGSFTSAENKYKKD